MDIGSILSEIFSWISNWLLGITIAVNWLPASMIDLGNGCFNASINICTGFLFKTPVYSYPASWEYVKNLAAGDVAVGIANDLFVVFFLITLIDYSITVRAKVDPEDIFKMLAKALIAQLLVFHAVDLMEAFWSSVSRVVSSISPSKIDMLSYVQLPIVSSLLIFILDLILGLVYIIVMAIFSFKIISAFFERFVWAFLMVPFGGPAFATAAGSGRFNAASKAYVKFAIVTMLEFIAFALLVNLLSLLRTDFINLLLTWFDEALGGADNTFISCIVRYFSNMCFAGLVCALITKLDGKVEKMFAL